MESTANLMIFCGICRKFDKFHGKQQNAMANLETGVTVHYRAVCAAENRLGQTGQQTLGHLELFSDYVGLTPN